MEGKDLSDLKTSSVRCPEWWVEDVGGVRRMYYVQQGNLQLSRDEAPEQADEEHLTVWLWRSWLTTRVCCWCSQIGSNSRDGVIILLGLYVRTPNPSHKSSQELLSSADGHLSVCLDESWQFDSEASFPLLNHILFQFPPLELYPEPSYKGTPLILVSLQRNPFPQCS